MRQNKNTVIFDLDGTLALIDHRLKHIKNIKRKNWFRFFEECDKDEPNIPVIEVCKSLFLSGHNIIIFSGRSAQVRSKTEEWLSKHEIKYNKLFMRPEKDYTPDEKLKETWLKEIDTGDILCVFDDRQKVVDMWRKNNITCFQVAEGDF